MRALARTSCCDRVAGSKRNARDGRGINPENSLQDQRCARGRGDGRMGKDNHQGQPTVADGVLRVRQFRSPDQFGFRGLVCQACPERVLLPVAGRCDQPGNGIVRHATFRPGPHTRHLRPHQCRGCGKPGSGPAAQNCCGPPVRRPARHPKGPARRSFTGREHRWKHGTRFDQGAKRRRGARRPVKGCIRSATSITKYPPSRSLVSAKGPSLTSRLPSRMRSVVTAGDPAARRLSR